MHYIQRVTVLPWWWQKKYTQKQQTRSMCDMAKPWTLKLHVRYWPREHLVLLYCTISPSAYILPLKWTKSQAHIKQPTIIVPYHSLNSNLTQPTDTQPYSRRKKVDSSLTDQHSSMSHFHGNTLRNNFFCGHNILTNCVGCYDKLLFPERLF